jgi:hypothetical protein
MIKLHKTPYKGDAFVVDICRLLAGAKPVYVPIQAEPYAEEAQCANNVVEKVKRDGGSTACGWQITLLPDRYFSAFFHVVWRANDGTLVDVTPAQSAMQDKAKTLFVEDSSYGCNLDRKLPSHLPFPVRAPRTWGTIAAKCRELDSLNENGKDQEHALVARQLEDLINPLVEA